MSVALHLSVCSVEYANLCMDRFMMDVPGIMLSWTSEEFQAHVSRWK